MKINIRNLQIKYNDRQIAYIDDLSLQSGELVLLTGHSGTGKSSVLKLLSLADDIHFDCDYFINDKNINSFKENKINRFKMRNIAYISQECLVFNEFTVLENLETFCQIGYNKVLKKKIDPLVNLLQLDKILNKKAKKLSGGERQRVAIACGVLKNADLYLFDEPTSMIDIDNKKAVLQLINSLAKQGKIVVVVTHEKQYFNADKEYFFEDGTAKLIKNNLSNQLVAENEKKPSFNIKAFIKKMAQKIFISTPISNAVYIMMGAVCISLIIAIFNLSIASVKGQKATAQVVNAPELQVINQQEFTGGGNGHIPSALSIEDEMKEKISNLEHVVSVNRFTFFSLSRSNHLMTVDNNLGPTDDLFTFPTLMDSNISLLKGEEEISQFNYLETFGKDDDNNYSQTLYAICPIYPYQDIEKTCNQVYQTDERGIYINPRIAKELGIDNLNGESIQLRICIPIANMPTIIMDGLNNNHEFLGNERLNIETFETFVIKGILKEDVRFIPYGIAEYPDFFMDIKTIEEIQNEYYEKNKLKIHELSQKKVIDSYINQYFDTYLITDDIYKSGSLVVQVDKTENLDIVADQIRLLDPGLAVNITDRGMPSIDKAFVDAVWSSAFTYSTIIFVILLLSLIIIKTFRRKRRKNDHRLLKINGFTKHQMNSLEKHELLIEICLVSILSLLLVILFTFLFNKRTMYPASFNIWCVVGVILLTSFTLYIGNIISKQFKK